MLQASPRGSDVPDLEQGLCNGVVESSSSRDGLGQHSSGPELSSGQHRKHDVKPDRTILGLALYGISSLFLATVLMCAKLLGKPFYLLPLWQICHHTESAPFKARPEARVYPTNGALLWGCSARAVLLLFTFGTLYIMPFQCPSPACLRQ